MNHVRILRITAAPGATLWAGLLAGGLATGGAPAPGQPNPVARVQLHGPGGYEETLSVPGVDSADGVSREESLLISEYVFTRIAGVACGTVDLPVDAGSSWRVQTKIGYAGTPGAPIEINKHDGSVEWSDLSLLQYSQIEPAPGVHVIGPRPLSAPFGDLSLTATELQAVGEGKLSVTLIVMIDPSGAVVNVRPGYVKGAASNTSVVSGLQAIVAHWRFYPELLYGSTVSQEHSLMFILGESAPTNQP